MPQHLQMTRRRLQVFVSSTQADLLEERQEAVETILKAGHIPAGMEHFAADNDSSLDVIKEWIDESDVYMVIVGFRYGSIEPKSGKSFTQVEYEYAVSTGKPVFAVLMTDKWRIAKQKGAEDPASVTERVRPGDLEAFRTLAKQKNCRFVDDRSGIGLAIHESLALFQRKYKLVGWVRGDADDKRQELEIENAGLTEKLAAAERQQAMLEGWLAKAKLGEGPDWKAAYNALSKLTIDLTAIIDADDIEDLHPLHKKMLKLGSVLNYFGMFRSGFINGISASKSDPIMYALFHHVAPHLAIYGLVDEVSVPKGMPQQFKITKEGKNFLIWFDEQVAEKSPKNS
jgi:hypothetical protein